MKETAAVQAEMAASQGFPQHLEHSEHPAMQVVVRPAKEHPAEAGNYSGQNKTRRAAAERQVLSDNSSFLVFRYKFS